MDFKNKLKGAVDKIAVGGLFLKHGVVSLGAKFKKTASNGVETVKESAQNAADSVKEVASKAAETVKPKDPCECLNEDWEKFKDTVYDDLKEFRRLLKLKCSCLQK